MRRWLLVATVLGATMPIVGCSERTSCYTFIGIHSARPMLLDTCSGTVVAGTFPDVTPPPPPPPPSIPTTTTTTLPRVAI